MKDDRFALTSNEKINPLWMKINRHLTTRLAELRAQNDCDMTLEQTHKQRGKIAEVKALLDLGLDDPVID